VFIKLGVANCFLYLVERIIAYPSTSPIEQENAALKTQIADLQTQVADLQSRLEH